VHGVWVAVCDEGQSERSHAAAHRCQAVPVPALQPVLPNVRPSQESRRAAFQGRDVAAEENSKGSEEQSLRDGVCGQWGSDVREAGDAG